MHAREFSRQNADIIAHDIEGVPWAELLADKPFSDEFQRMEGEEGSDSQGRQGLPRHLTGAGRLEAGGEVAAIPDGTRGQVLRRSRRHEGLPEIVPAHG